jgi:ketosteroid isomerase-like protein
MSRQDAGRRTFLGLAAAVFGLAPFMRGASAKAAQKTANGDYRIALAHRLFDGIEQSDPTTFQATCLPDATIWQAHRPDSRGPFREIFDRQMKQRAWIETIAFIDRTYDLLLDGDVVLRHAMVGVTKGGKPFTAYMMIRLIIRDQKIAHIDQVVDSAKMQPIYEEMKNHPESIG